ncbi:ParB N-terminal domain-containing protein [Gloeocapsopsis dulcis]|uniref:ParB N-terminal domain-containing protein n=1 Tax=Gloeocapsopsis dulcis TaxID=2859516 RepID=UPI0012DA5B43|nr:ParB N-terminal domain-containing protein [Gloeocapsopsis dulcis]WNN92184.1 ParB N-terminal domain-containing protein [Gloeocapsopsis dulcis]
MEEQIKKQSPGSRSSTSSYLTLDEIRRDGGTQPRAAIDLKHVKLLEEQIEDGKELEPIIVFYDGESYWLADGFHRYAAHKNQDIEAIECVIHHGTRREAVLYLVGANAEHKPALPRSREDKRRAVITLLQDPEWGKWSDHEIARYCKVDNKTVGKIRGSVTEEFLSEKRTYKTKHGTTAAMNTANINKKPTAQVLQLPDNDSVATTHEQELQHFAPKEVEYSSSNQDGLKVDSIVNQLLPQTVEVDTNDILIAFTSNIEYMSEAQLEAAVRAISTCSS